MTTRWVPPTLDENETKEFLTVKSGIPKTARRSLARWIVKASESHHFMSTQWITDFERKSGCVVFESYGETERAASLWKGFERIQERTLVDLLDYRISNYNIKATPRPESVKRLERLLDDSSAGWQVGIRAGNYGLLKRTPEGVEDVVDYVVSHEQRASSFLKQAWDQAFGSQSDPSNAYRLAVKAVESVAIPEMDLNSPKATLGTCIGQLKNPGKNWSFVLAGADDQDSIGQLRETMNLLWGSHHDRHAGDEKYRDITEHEAQAAVLLANTLVGWFSLGFFTRS